MRHAHIILLLCSASALPAVSAAELDLFVAAQDAPLYQLSNFRTEVDTIGSQVMLFDFKRTRQGTGSVSVRGKTASGYLSIAAVVTSTVDSGTMQLKSFFPNGEQKPVDIELFFARSHNWGDGKTRYEIVSNSLRIGDPGPALQPRAWTTDEEKAYADYRRIMQDDLAQKPRKSYPVSIDVAADAQFLPQDARVVPGTPLEACYSGKWCPLTAISENKDGSVNVRWDEYGATYDCSMTRDELAIKKVFLTKASQDGFLTTVSRVAAEKGGLIEIPPKPRKKYPVSIAVPSHSQVVPKDLTVTEGTKLQACYAGKWNPITALSENKDGSLNVRWDDYGPTFDCSMIRDELIIRKTVVKELQEALAKGNSPASKAPEWRTWTDATGKFTVRAKLLRKSDSTVTLQTEAGREVSLPLEKLSEADRAFLSSSAVATEAGR